MNNVATLVLEKLPSVSHETFQSRKYNHESLHWHASVCGLFNLKHVHSKSSSFDAISVRTCKIYGNVMDGQGSIMGGIMKKETLRGIPVLQLMHRWFFRVEKDSHLLSNRHEREDGNYSTWPGRWRSYTSDGGRQPHLITLLNGEPSQLFHALGCNRLCRGSSVTRHQ